MEQEWYLKMLFDRIHEDEKEITARLTVLEDTVKVLSRMVMEEAKRREEE